MVEMISLKQVDKKSRIELLRAIGYDSDGRFVTRDGEPVVDGSVGEKVTLDNMLILPGSSVIISDNPLSIAAYFEEHGDWD
jgi:hypothetical protein